MYRIDIRSIQNTYQIDSLFSLEKKGLTRHAYRVQYVSNPSWSRTITNEITYWSILIFNFETVITFSYF